MVRWIAIHLPHIVPPLIAFAFLARMAVWAAAQPPSHYTDEQVEEWNRTRAARRRERNLPVRARTARLGLIAIGPLAFIWSWNTLFGSALAIEYTFWTWLAAAVFMAILAPNVRVTKK